MYSIEERSERIVIGNKEYRLILTTKATKEITKRYGGLDKLGDKLLQGKSMEQSLDEVLWLITLLANQSILIGNLTKNEQSEPLLTEEEVELFTSPSDLAGFKDAIMSAMLKGTKREIESEELKQGNATAGQSPLK